MGAVWIKKKDLFALIPLKKIMKIMPKREIISQLSY